MNPWGNEIDAQDFEVRVAEMLVATADGADALIDEAVPEVLRMLRTRLQMDVVFVSEFVGGQRVVRHLEVGPTPLAPPRTEPLESSWCQYVVDGRLPELGADVAALQAAGRTPTPLAIGSYLSTPIVLSGGEVYGTLCCISRARNRFANEQSLKTLRYTARLTAVKIERARQQRAASRAEGGAQAQG